MRVDTSDRKRQIGSDPRLPYCFDVAQLRCGELIPQRKCKGPPPLKQAQALELACLAMIPITKWS